MPVNNQDFCFFLDLAYIYIYINLDYSLSLWYSARCVRRAWNIWKLDKSRRHNFSVTLSFTVTRSSNRFWNLFTSCCGTAIERLSAFTEFYLKPLSQSLPSFVKDSTDFINKLEDLNAKGPFPAGSLLVSWDVVSMFPNIDNNLGVSAVRRALNSRSDNILSTLSWSRWNLPQGK